MTQVTNRETRTIKLLQTILAACPHANAWRFSNGTATVRERTDDSILLAYNDGAFQVLHRPPGDGDPPAAIFAPDLASARRNLAREQLRFAQPRRPIRNQSAVSRTSDRIFRDSLRGREEPRHKIAVSARRGDDRRERIDRRQPLHIRFQRAHLGLRVEHAKKIARPQSQLRRRYERIEKLRGELALDRRTGREVERIKIPVASDGQFTTP